MEKVQAQNWSIFPGMLWLQRAEPRSSRSGSIRLRWHQVLNSAQLVLIIIRIDNSKYEEPFTGREVTKILGGFIHCLQIRMSTFPSNTSISRMLQPQTYFGIEVQFKMSIKDYFFFIKLKNKFHSALWFWNT